jgi:hypothetical protein
LSRLTRFLVASNTAMHVSAVIEHPIELEEKRFRQGETNRMMLLFFLSLILM